MKTGYLALALAFAIGAQAHTEEIIQCTITRVIRNEILMPIEVGGPVFVGRLHDVDVDFIGVSFVDDFRPEYPDYLIGEIVGDFRWDGSRFQVKADGNVRGSALKIEARGRIDDPRAQARISLLSRMPNSQEIFINVEVAANECRRL